MEKKQSSIDYLIEQLEGENNRIAMVVGVKKYNSIIQQAKAMHKEEVKESYREGRTDQQSQEAFYHRNAELYFNETFGGTTGGIGVDKISWTNTSGTNHLSHINPLTDKLTNGGNNE